MNDLTEPVGAGPWLAPDGVEAASPTADPGAGPDPRLDALSQIDWQAWAERDPRGAGAAWQALVGDMPFADGPDDDPDRILRLQAVDAELARDIEGWSPELRADLTAYGQARGFSAEELAGVEDPREIKILHLAMLGEQALAAQRQADAFGRFRPPTTLGGHGHPGHAPTDRNSTDAWMQARRAQLRKKARG